MNQVTAARPDEVDSPTFVEDYVVPALRAAGGARWGRFRDAGGVIATDAVGYYRGAGDPVDGSSEVAIVIVTLLGEPAWFPAGQTGTWAAP